MNVTDVEVFHVKIPLGRFTWSPVIIKVNTNNGFYGVGEIALAIGEGSTAGLHMVHDLAKRFLVGAEPMQSESIWNKMYHETFWAQGGGPIIFGAISAIDEALWDIKGKALGVPVYELLGGKCRDRLWLYANGWYEECISPDDYVREAKRVVGDGYTAMKFDPFAITEEGVWEYPKRVLDRGRADLAYERVKAVREAVGPKVEIMIEVHGNLGTSQAIKMGRRLEELDPFFYEEPVDPFNVESMKKVSENVKIPIAAGERLYTRYRFRQYIEKQAIDILQPDIGLTGGITETKKIANYAETYNLHVQPHNCAGPVATAAAVQIDANIPNFIVQEWFPYWPEPNYKLVKNPLEHQQKNGYITIPKAAGLGIELNEEALSQYESITAK